MVGAKTGAEAVAHAVALCKPKVIAAYPITPQTHIIEELATKVGNGELEASYICTDSELSSIGIVAGAVAEGVRAFTATSSHGLALMHEGLHWVAGGRLPVVMAVATRGLGAPWILMCDHQDALSQRDTGWMMLFASNAQEAQDFIPIAYRVAEEVHIPCMVCMDGFLISHTLEPVVELTEKEVESFLPPFIPKLSLEQIEGTLWPIPDADTYHRIREELFMDHLESLKLWEKAFSLWDRITGRRYSACKPFMTDDASTIFVAMGASAGTTEEVVERLRRKGEKAGSITVKLFRPFPCEELRRLTEKAERIIVIDKGVSFGSMGILAQEVASCTGRPVVSFIGSMGGKELTPEDIEAAYRTPKEEGVLWN